MKTCKEEATTSLPRVLFATLPLLWLGSSGVYNAVALVVCLFNFFSLPSTTTDFFSHSNREWQCEIFKAFFTASLKQEVLLGEHKFPSNPFYLPFSCHSDDVVLYVQVSLDT
jgi:hypothetical protein